MLGVTHQEQRFPFRFTGPQIELSLYNLRGLNRQASLTSQELHEEECPISASLGKLTTLLVLSLNFCLMRVILTHNTHVTPSLLCEESPESFRRRLVIAVSGLPCSKNLSRGR